MVRRHLENGSYEWGVARGRSGGRSKWTRDFQHASVWLHQRGPIAFMSYIRKKEKIDKNKDNNEVKMVTFRLEEIESR